jgi:hypothetical protein
MKQLKTSVLFLFMLMILLPLAEGQKPVPRDKALNVLLRTNRFIGHAHMAVSRGKVYTGNLGKAVRHQRYAKALFLKGNYLRAIQHSRKARLHALAAVKANKVKPTSDATITPEETAMMETVTDEELEAELTKENVAELKDEDLVKNNKLDLEVK